MEDSACGCCCCCCKIKREIKLTVIFSWIQIVLYTITSSIVVSSIFILFLTNGITQGALIAFYTSKLGLLPVNLVGQILMAISIIPNNQDISPTQEELRFSSLILALILLLFFHLPAVATGIYLLKGVQQENSTCAVRTWTVFAVVWFILSVMEIVAGGYINGILAMTLYAIAIWIIHKEKRKRRDFQNRIV